MKIIKIVLLLLFINASLIAQESKINLGVLDFKILKQTEKFLSRNMANESKNVVESSKIYIIERFIQDSRFEIVERAKLNLVNNELELQKSENFMDGYVVNQGESIGADYLLYGIFNPDNKELTISLFSIADNNVKSSQIIPLKKTFWGVEKYKEKIQDATSQLINKEFPVQIPMIEILDGDSKAKEVLVAGGTKNGFNTDDDIVFYYESFKVVRKDTFKREVTLASGKVEEVENENFSRVKITKGKKEIKAQFDLGTNIFCKLKKK